MAIVNHAKQEINAKIVYFGAPGAGKATSLRYIYDRVKPSLRGAMRVQPTAGSNLHFFDFSPFDQPVFGGYRLRFHVYTLHGKVENRAAWKMTLKGADGLVFVMDGSADALLDSQKSLSDMSEYLNAYGVGLGDIPMVLQVNKADLSPFSAADQALLLGLEGCSACLTTATAGTGVLETLSTLSRDVMSAIRDQEHLQAIEASAPADAAAGNVAVEADASAEMAAAGQGEAESDAYLASEMDLSKLVQGVPAAEIPEKHAAVPAETPAAASSGDLRIEVAPSGVIHSGNLLKIPLEISQAGDVRRLVLTISIGSE